VHARRAVIDSAARGPRAPGGVKLVEMPAV